MQKSISKKKVSRQPLLYMMIPYVSGLSEKVRRVTIKYVLVLIRR